MNSQLLLQVTDDLPPPSKVMWEDMKRILVNPKAINIPTVKLSEQTKEETEQDKHIQKIAKRTSIVNSIFLCNTTEMDACHRVFCLFMPVLVAYEHIKISSQPTVKGYSVFTNYMFYLTSKDDPQPLLIIEVKREATSCHISTTPAFAQVLREVHIIGQDLTLLPFMLTNSSTWTIGYCSVANQKKIELLSAASVFINHNVDTDNSEAYKTILHFFRDYITSQSSRSSQT